MKKPATKNIITLTVCKYHGKHFKSLQQIYVLGEHRGGKDKPNWYSEELVKPLFTKSATMRQQIGALQVQGLIETLQIVKDTFKKSEIKRQGLTMVIMNKGVKKILEETPSLYLPEVSNFRAMIKQMGLKFTDINFLYIPSVSKKKDQRLKHTKSVILKAPYSYKASVQNTIARLHDYCLLRAKEVQKTLNLKKQVSHKIESLALLGKSCSTFNHVAIASKRPSKIDVNLRHAVAHFESKKKQNNKVAKTAKQPEPIEMFTAPISAPVTSQRPPIVPDHNVRKATIQHGSYLSMDKVRGLSDTIAELRGEMKTVIKQQDELPQALYQHHNRS